MMLRHWQARRMLLAYVEGTLDAQKKQAVERHRKECPACEARLTHLERRHRLLIESRPEPEALAPEQATAIFLHALEASRIPEPPATRSASGRLALAGGMAIGTLILLAVVLRPHSPNAPLPYKHPLASHLSQQSIQVAIGPVSTHKNGKGHPDAVRKDSPPFYNRRVRFPALRAHSLFATTSSWKRWATHPRRRRNDRENLSAHSYSERIAVRTPAERKSSSRRQSADEPLHLQISHQPEATPGYARIDSVQREDDGTVVRIESTARSAGQNVTLTNTRTIRKIGSMRPTSVLSIETTGRKDRLQQGAS